MPIIIDNFQVNTSAPIDNRFVVGPGLFYLTKDDINYKYVGLRVWDSNDNIPYYWAGTEWLSENSVGVLADTNSLLAGESGYITKFTSGPTVVGKSLIYENQTTKQLGIGLIGGNINANYGSNPVQFGLHVAGNIKTNSYFIGNGLYITDINASNVNSGLLNIQYISPTQPNSNISPVAPGNSYVLFNNGSGIVSWRDTNNLSVLNSTNTTNVNVVSETSTTPHFVTFVLPGAAAVPIKYNSSKMQFKPDNGQLFLSNGGTTNPVYSFINSTNTGMYYDGYNINFSISGVNRVSISPGVITIYDSNYAQIDFYKSPTDVQKLFVGQGSILKYRTNSWDPNGAVQVASDNIVWHSGNLYTLRDSGNLPLETGRSINSISTDANGNQIQGVYTYNVYNTAIAPSSQIHWSVLSFGRGVNGSVQLASNWFSGINTTSPGTVYAERDILLRSLRDTGESWSPWVKIWNSGNSGYVPFGAIMMWSGTIAQIPTGWRLCDGSPAVTIPAGSVPGQPSIISITIPDLRERFVVGAGNSPAIPTRDTYDSFLYYHWSTNVTLTGTFAINTGGSNPNTFNIDTTRLFYINSTGVGVQMSITNSLQIGSLNIRPMIHTCTPLLAFVAFDMRINQYRMFKGTATNGTTYNTNYFTFNTATTNGLGTWVEYNKYFENGIRFNLPRTTGAETSPLATILWQNGENSYAVGATGGSDMVRISQSQLGPHNHVFPGDDQLFYANNQAGWTSRSVANFRYDADSSGSTSNPDNGNAKLWLTSDTGGFQPVENRPPYYALAFIIYTGI